MRKWRASAAYRIAFLNFAAYAAGLAVLGILVFAVLHIALTHELGSMVTKEAETLAATFRQSGDNELTEAIAYREAASPATHMMYGVYSPDGRRVHGSLRAPRPQLGLHSIIFNDPGEGPDSAIAKVVDLSSTERLVVAVDSDWLETVERIVIVIFSIAFVVACAAGFGGAIILGGYLRRRLRSLGDSAEAIIAGNVQRRMPVSASHDEFDHLAATLNRMLDRIQALLESLRQVSNDVAHDLRTPLARLRNMLDRGSGDDAEAIIADATQQVDEVLALFAAILRLAEVESGETRRFFADVDVSSLVAELAESYALALEDQQRHLCWSVESDLHTTGDRELLAQAMINLLENAQRHTPVGTIVRLTACSVRNSLCLQVSDSGPGVPKADLGRITKRFARLESSRNTAGHGLGLSLVSAVAKLHGGKLILKNSDPGLSAIMELPLQKPASAHVDEVASRA